MWNSDWDKALEMREPREVSAALAQILSAARECVDAREKACMLLAAGTCYRILGDQESVRRMIDAAGSIGPLDDKGFSAHLAFQEAAYQTDHGQYEASFNTLEALLCDYSSELGRLELHYLDEQVRLLRGIALALLQRFEEALPVLEESLRFDLVPADRGNLLCHLGTCQFELGKDDLAIQSFLQAHDFGVPADFMATYYFYLGRAYYHLKDYKNAKHAFLECERLLTAGHRGPQPKDLYKLLSYCSLGLAEKSEADTYSRLMRSV